MEENVIGYILIEAPFSVPTSKPKIIHSDEHRIIFEAKLQEGDQLNRNRRVYPTGLLAESLKSPRIQERLETGNLFGELNHPSSNTPQRQFEIDFTRASHIIRDIRQEGKSFIGTIETSATSVGKDFRGLIEYNSVRPGFSMRGFGKAVKRTRNESGANTNYNLVEAPLEIVTYDAVTFPSHPGSYVVSTSSQEPVMESYQIPVTDGEIQVMLQEDSGNYEYLRDMLESDLFVQSVPSNTGKTVVLANEFGERVVMKTEDIVRRNLLDILGIEE